MSDRDEAVELVVTGRWTATARAAVLAGEVDRVVLNYALGFDEPSLTFLQELPVRELVILDPRLSDLEPIHSLGSTLRALCVTTNPGLRLDLGKLPGLRTLRAAWPQVSASIETASNVQVAFLRAYKPVDLTPLAAWSNLAELEMKDRPKLKSLAGLAAFPELRKLGVYLAKDLREINALADRSEITDLALQACRQIERIDALSGCTGLRRLDLSECGDIASLNPLRHLTRLERISLFGSTKITDNDLSPLAELPRLQSLRMQGRRSYLPSVHEIQSKLPRG
ncbi:MULTISPECIES: hypothetical protein [Microbacterium]|uniref:hypothetical protein n=1 Tax=Microbacterium TaxID=33882 RepID=UPI00146DA8BA|nr:MULTISPECIES: hypothetical protein [Microbacterium]